MPLTESAGRIAVHATDPTTLVLTGEVDHDVVGVFTRGTPPGAPGWTRGLDLSGVTFLDAAAIGLVARLAVARELTGGRLVCTGASPFVLRLLAETHVLPRLTVVP